MRLSVKALKTLQETMRNEKTDLLLAGLSFFAGLILFVFLYIIKGKGGVRMCSKNQLNMLLRIVAEEAKDIFKTKLHSVILYGSYARGDYDEESDVDIMILVDMPAENLADFRRRLDSLCGSLLYDYGIVVSITERDLETYNRYAKILPFYQNIEREGVKIA